MRMNRGEGWGMEVGRERDVNALFLFVVFSDTGASTLRSWFHPKSKTPSPTL